jgi:hypothetical protein
MEAAWRWSLSRLLARWSNGMTLMFLEASPRFSPSSSIPRQRHVSDRLHGDVRCRLHRPPCGGCFFGRVGDHIGRKKKVNVSCYLGSHGRLDDADWLDANILGSWLVCTDYMDWDSRACKSRPLAGIAEVRQFMLTNNPRITGAAFTPASSKSRRFWHFSSC